MILVNLLPTVRLPGPGRGLRWGEDELGRGAEALHRQRGKPHPVQLGGGAGTDMYAMFDIEWKILYMGKRPLPTSAFSFKEKVLVVVFPKCCILLSQHCQTQLTCLRRTCWLPSCSSRARLLASSGRGDPTGRRRGSGHTSMTASWCPQTSGSRVRIVDDDICLQPPPYNPCRSAWWGTREELHGTRLRRLVHVRRRQLPNCGHCRELRRHGYAHLSTVSVNTQENKMLMPSRHRLSMFDIWLNWLNFRVYIYRFSSSHALGCSALVSNKDKTQLHAEFVFFSYFIGIYFVLCQTNPF